VLDGLDLRLLNLNPLVLIADGFASPEECAAAIRAAEGKLERARILDANFVSQVSEVRTNRHAVIDHRKDGMLWGLCLKLGVLLRLPFNHAEPLNVLNYQPGEEFQPHSDGHDPSRTGAEAELPRGGQRLFTAIVYLNDVTGGGGTAFPELGLEVAPKRGRLLLFANTWAGSRELCALSVHAGLPVTGGEKWAATFWWREKPYDYALVGG